MRTRRPGRDPSRECAPLGINRAVHRWRTGEIVREVKVPGPVFETLEQCSKAQSGRIEHVHESQVHAYECRHDNLEATI
jgi:hypothetical protein